MWSGAYFTWYQKCLEEWCLAGKFLPRPTGHLNSQKGNGWKAQNSIWENRRRGKYTVAVLRPDTLEKLRGTISSAILFCQVMWNLILRLIQKCHRGPCTSRIFLLLFWVEIFLFFSKSGLLYVGPTCCSVPSSWYLETSLRQGWDKQLQKEDRFIKKKCCGH